MEAKWNKLGESSLEERVVRTYFEGKAAGISHSDLVEKILELANSEWKEAEKYIPSFSYSEEDPRTGCSTDNYGVVIDPISLLEIPRDKLISFLDMGKKWCFDIDSLAEYTRRSKAENPITRRPLPESVVEELRAYEKATKTILFEFVGADGVKDSIEVIRGTALIEVAIDMLRSYNSPVDNSILYKVTAYKVSFDLPDWTFETEIEEAVPARITNGGGAAYLRRLLESTSKRYAMQSISDQITYRLGKLIARMTVIDCILYQSKVAGMNGILFANPFYREGEQLISFYDRLETVADYGKKVRQFVAFREGRATLSYTFGREDFLKHFREPQDSSKNVALDKKVWMAIEKTLHAYTLESIEEKDFQSVQKLIQFASCKYNVDFFVKAVNAFSPEKVQELYGDRLFPEIARYNTKDIPEIFIANGYYAKHLGFKDQEVALMTNYFLKGKGDLSPKLQAKLVAIFNDTDLYGKYRTTLNRKVLYKYIEHFDAEGVANLLEEREKIELVLGYSYGLKITNIPLAFEVLEEFIANDRPISSLGFNIIFLDIYDSLEKPPLDYAQLEPLLLRLGRDSFKEIIVGLQFVIFDSGRTDHLLSQEFLTDLYIRIIRNRKISLRLKIDTFAYYLDRMASTGRNLPESVIQSILQNFSLRNYIEMYETCKSKKYHMSLSSEWMVEMAATNNRLFELAVEVGAISQEQLITAAKFAINEWMERKQFLNWEPILYYLTIESLEKLNYPIAVVFRVTDNGEKKVKSRYLQMYIRNNEKAQEKLVNIIVKNNRSVNTTGVLSILGVLSLLKMGALIDLSQVCNLFEGVEITPERKERILSYPYLKMMYGDSL